MKTAIITLLATLLFATAVRADTAPVYRVHWTFTQLTDDRFEDYSTNLDIPLAATLPDAAVKAGWACVRMPIFKDSYINTATWEQGFFDCTNGTEDRYTIATCFTNKIDTDNGRLLLFVPGAPTDGIEFRISCASLPQ